jgi:1,4-dihydroxy-2-naphthoate octaprenyltransferase
MQLGCNLHNDYADFVKGADNDLRVGQARATAKGWLSPTTTARAAGTTLLCGFVVGMKLVSLLVSSGTSPSSWTVVLMVGIIISSIFSAFAYTGGPWPLGYIGLSGFSLGYSGLGDLFVFLYFGIVATTTPVFFYLACITRSNGLESTLDDSYNWKIMVQMMSHSLQVAVLAVNIIIVNNLRDRQTDVSANKRTLAVRLGATFCRMEYGFMIGVAFGLVLFDFFANGSHATSYWKLLPLLSFPLACKEWKAICVKDGSGLNPHVGGAAKVQFLFCILLAISLRKSEWLPSTND